jgi:DNA-binding HxlR family transcriptional regulator
MKNHKDHGQDIDALRDSCPIKAAIDVIRGRWKPLIIWELSQSVRRFSSLQDALIGCHAQVLTTQLRQLEADGVIERTVYQEIPPRVEYSLTKHGNLLSATLEQLHAWGECHLKR